MRWRVVATAAVIALLAAACGDRINDPMQMRPAAEPLDLVGLWQVEAALIGEPGRLRLDAEELELIRPDGSVHGSWGALPDTFVADTWAATVSGGHIPRPDWLVGVHPYVLTTDGGWQILDEDGEVLATMTPADGEEAPEVTEEVRRALREPAALPEGLDIPAAEDLLGRWVPAGETFETDPHVEMLDDATWRGSDGCNGAGGLWALGEEGRLLTTAGPMTAIGCAGAAVGSWLAQAARAGVDGDELVLLDRDAAELARLARG